MPLDARPLLLGARTSGAPGPTRAIFWPRRLEGAATHRAVLARKHAVMSLAFMAMTRRMHSLPARVPDASSFAPRRLRLKCCAYAVGVVLAQPYAGASSAAETCRFEGTTDYAGRVSVTTTAAASGETMRVDVAVRFEATTALWLHLHYLVEEISQWRNGALLRLDANTRYMFAGHIVRQQWDEFRSAPDGLQGYRIEGKRPAQFRRQHPRFAQHWDLASFGANWLNEFASAAPDRRPDLDLPRLPEVAAVQSPFALAFYWVRFLHPGARHEPVFLPGFKADKRADIAMESATAGDGRLWRAVLHHSYLSAAPASTAAAQISADGHLQRLSFALHGSAGSATGSLHQAGCAGRPAP